MTWVWQTVTRDIVTLQWWHDTWHTGPLSRDKFHLSTPPGESKPGWCLKWIRPVKHLKGNSICSRVGREFRLRPTTPAAKTEHISEEGMWGCCVLSVSELVSADIPHLGATHNNGQRTASGMCQARPGHEGWTFGLICTFAEWTGSMHRIVMLLFAASIALLINDNVIFFEFWLWISLFAF